MHNVNRHLSGTSTVGPLQYLRDIGTQITNLPGQIQAMAQRAMRAVDSVPYGLGTAVVVVGKLAVDSEWLMRIISFEGVHIWLGSPIYKSFIFSTHKPLIHSTTGLLQDSLFPHSAPLFIAVGVYLPLVTITVGQSVTTCRVFFSCVSSTCVQFVHT